MTRARWTVAGVPAALIILVSTLTLSQEKQSVTSKYFEGEKCSSMWQIHLVGITGQSDAKAYKFCRATGTTYYIKDSASWLVTVRTK